MSDRNIMYGVIGVLVLVALLAPSGSFRWEEMKRTAVLLFFALVVGGGLWYLARKRKP